MSQSSFSKKNSPVKSPRSTKPKGTFGARMKNTPVSFRIQSLGFPPFGIECYDYSKIVADAVSEGYTIPFRHCMEPQQDDHHIPFLIEAGFFAAVFQRANLHINNRLTGGDNWPRYWMLRLVPGDNPSTPETRREGTEILKALFLDLRYTQYPPKSIACADITNAEPMAMQNFFLDRDILRLIRHCVGEDDYNPRFFSEFPDHARVIFPGPTYPADAVVQLGFGYPVPRPSHAPGFEPGPQPNNGNEDEESDDENDNE